MFRNMPVVALEEHYWDKELSEKSVGFESARSEWQMKRLFDFDELRLGEMDSNGIDVQVISHGAPSIQRMKGQEAVDLARRCNDRLAEQIARHPKRFYGFGMLPTDVPDAAADELERCMRDLNFRGAMLHGQSNGRFLDNQFFWPVFERASALGAPIYLHPATADPRVSEAYYADYVKAFPMVVRPAWGYTVETATLAIRLVLSGVFEKHAGLQVILGHMGETLPYQLWRIDQALARPGQDSMSFRKIFCDHFHITTSGHFSTPALHCAMMELGLDRIMFSIDWPFVPNEPGMEWVKTLQMNEADMGKFLGGNAKRLLQLP
jgi:predicted TIM-barrel fold metal-dependent hydrolase